MQHRHCSAANVANAAMVAVRCAVHICIHILTRCMFIPRTRTIDIETSNKFCQFVNFSLCCEAFFNSLASHEFRNYRLGWGSFSFAAAQNLPERTEPTALVILYFVGNV